MGAAASDQGSLVELAAWPGTCSPGSGMSAMVHGGLGRPGFMRLVADAITKWPGPGQQPAPTGAARGLQGSAAPGARPRWADPQSIA
jgi:hypothetical protein